MSDQSILYCTEKYNDVINLLNNFIDGRESISNAKEDIHISLKILRKVTTDVGRAASNHFTAYSKILRKRKIFLEEDEFYLEKLNAEIAHLKIQIQL